MYIIDGNNLAGKLDILFEENFDKILISIVKNNFRGRDVVLVFDSIEFMGDIFYDENIKVIYSPKDGYCDSADDKIIEIVRGNKGNEIILVTSDVELKRDVEKHNCRVVSSDDVAKKILAKKYKQENKNIINDIGSDDRDEINQELFKKWVK